MEIQICTKCGEGKPIAEFYITFKSCKQCVAVYSKEYQKKNLEKTKKQRRKWREANKEKLRISNRIYREKNKEKIAKKQKAYRGNRFLQALRSSKEKATSRGYERCRNSETELREIFNGKCHVCGASEEILNHKLCLDHCHITGQARGWLCHNCNRSLGLLHDSLELVLHLAEYLKSSLLEENKHEQR